ncbi:MAG TPA: helix-turn-helix transcriptional regulator, partial [Acidimicrobiales bacterium]|nr:helix-turn-helix transcriptional regulator [Acidimicrobiales bacterium]
RAVLAGRASGHADLSAMALQAKGRLLVEAGRIVEGLALLDEAMVAVVNGELSPLFTGWVYCNVLSACHDLADLRRAGQWSDAAMRWCDQLQDGLLYPGICRLHVVELACLRGHWPVAEAEARRACAELTAHDPRYAGEAFYLAGELRRLAGDLDGAQEAFTHAHQLGRSPQPGLALVRLAQGRGEAAAKALDLALTPGPTSPLRRAQLLAARADVALEAGDGAAARAAADGLRAVARSVASPYLEAAAAATEGVVLLAEGDVTGACERLGAAVDAFRHLGLPYEGARARTGLGRAARAAGDEDTAVLELRAALSAFEDLGAAADAAGARAALGDPVPARPAVPDRAEPAPAPPGGRLTDRELEVIRLLSRGHTNREIASTLVLSEHTVARHLGNIFAKLGVATRSAATAYAYEHGLV